MEPYKVGLFIIVGILLLILLFFIVAWSFGFWYNSKPVIIMEAANNEPLQETINELPPVTSVTPPVVPAAGQMANKEMSRYGDITDDSSLEADIMSFPSREDSALSADSMYQDSALSAMPKDALSQASLHFSPSVNDMDSPLQGTELSEHEQQVLQKDLPISSSWTESVDQE